MKLILLFFILVPLTLSVAAAEPLKPGSYPVDPARSEVGFNVTNFLVMSVDGRFRDFAGLVRVPAGDRFEAMQWEGTVEAKSIDTVNESRDHHLRSPDFFDVEKYPQMKFKSTAVSGTPQAFELKGELTIKGITKEVSFQGTRSGEDWVLESRIHRADYGITSGPTIKDEARLKLRLRLQSPIASRK